jgi:hypothetical protein
MSTYSFLDTNATIVGPGGSVNLGQGAGTAEEGITITANEDIDNMTIAADGSGMHSLSANKSGVVTVRLLKTSPVNARLMQMYALQTASSQSHGQNTFSLSNSNLQDAVVAQQAAFKKVPDLTYAKDGGFVEWTWNAINVNRTLGSNA